MCTGYDFLGTKPALPSVENCILIKKYNKSSTYMRNMMQIHINPQPGRAFRGIGLDLHPIEGAQVRFCRCYHPIRAPERHLTTRLDVPLRDWAQCCGNSFMHPALIRLIR